MKRIVVLVTPQEKQAIKEKAGLVPLSAWIRCLIQSALAAKKGKARP